MQEAKLYFIMSNFSGAKQQSCQGKNALEESQSSLFQLKIIIYMRSKQSYQYSQSGTSQYFPKVNSTHTAQYKSYQSFRVYQEKINEESEFNRKNNSPEMAKFRVTTDGLNTSNLIYRGRNNAEKERRDSPKLIFRRTDLSPSTEKSYKRLNSKEKIQDRIIGKIREFNKTTSNPDLRNKRLATEENHDYLKLQEKLNCIENKIAEMKKRVTNKREEKQITPTPKAKPEKPKEEQQTKNSKPVQKAKEKKVNLKELVTQVPEQYQLHTLSKNPYSPKHNVYYISQIIKTYKDEKSLGRQHLLLSLQIFRILQKTRFATEDQMRQRQIKLPRKEGFQYKKSLIFDLDETLIHCNDSLNLPYDVKIPITFPTGEVIEAGINIRPYACEILKNLSRDFQIIVFTASHSCYANVVLDHLDPNKEFIQHRLFREHCYLTSEGMYCKDLRVMDREMTDMILVDNAAYSYVAQPDNGVPILPYYHGKTDYQLKALEQYLQSMTKTKDVRLLNRKTFQLHRYRNYYNDPDRLISELYLQQAAKMLF